MSKVKIDIAPKRKTKTCMVKGEPLVIDIDVSPRVIAEAMRADLKQQIEAQPSDKWDRSGSLKNGLHVSADGTEVRAPDGRLEHAEVRERFHDEVMSQNSLASKAVDKAIGDWLVSLMGGK